MSVSKKSALLFGFGCFLCCLAIAFLMTHRPSAAANLRDSYATTEMRDSSGELIPASETILSEDIFNEQDVELNKRLRDSNIVRNIFLVLQYPDEPEGAIQALVVVDDADIEDRQDEIVSEINKVIEDADFSIQDVVIMDAHGNYLTN